MYDSLAIRRWSARFLAMTATILTGAGIATLTLIPWDTQIPLDWLGYLPLNAPDHIGIWGLFAAPLALFLLALLLRWWKSWLPTRPARRKFIWFCLAALHLAAAAAQYVLVRDAIAVVQHLPG